MNDRQGFAWEMRLNVCALRRGHLKDRLLSIAQRGAIGQTLRSPARPLRHRSIAADAGYRVAFASDQLLDPSYNARLGAAHLGELMQDWEGLAAKSLL